MQAHIKAIYHNKSFLKTTQDIPVETRFGLLLDRTNFYAESGGQEYDTGKIMIGMEAVFEVEDVQVFNGYVLHIGHLKFGELKVGSKVDTEYDEVMILTLLCSRVFIDVAQIRRWPIRNNHTATHILNFALREILGDHIDQKGSLVAPTKLRFDFSHKTGVTLNELTKIEELSIDWIRRNVEVFSKDMDLKTAQKIPGLRAVFGEAYPDPVRVVTLEYSVDEMQNDITNPKWRSTSVEFCGGTCVVKIIYVLTSAKWSIVSRHVAKTGVIKDLVVTEESGIAKGIRRITAVTGREAYEVNRVADALTAKFDLIERKSGKDKDSALKAYTLVRPFDIYLDTLSENRYELQFGQELNQADISVLRKAQLKDRFARVRKAFDEENKARDKAASRIVRGTSLPHGG